MNIIIFTALLVALTILIYFIRQEKHKDEDIVMVKVKKEDLENYNRIVEEVKSLLESDYSIEEIINVIEKMKQDKWKI